MPNHPSPTPIPVLVRYRCLHSIAPKPSTPTKLVTIKSPDDLGNRQVRSRHIVSRLVVYPFPPVWIPFGSVRSGPLMANDLRVVVVRVWR